MNSDWRELLDRLLEGETLSDAEARALADALEALPGRRQAAEWLRYEAALRERLAPPSAETVALSRERLLAKALLREKRAFVARPLGPASLPKVSDLREGIPCAPPASELPAYPPEGAIREWPSGGRGVKPSGGKSLSRRAIAVAAVLAVAVAALVAGGRLVKHRPAQAREGAEHYAKPEASGEFEVHSPGRSIAQGGVIRRWDRLVAGPGGARLTAGGYCELAIDPKSELVVQGEPGKEEIDLKAGRVVSRITPARGQFRVRTPLGSLEVVGTEFITAVLPRSSQQGEEDMGKLRKAAVVTVMVVSGTVAYHFGDSVGLLSAGMGQAFGAEEEGAPNLPDCLGGFKGLLLGTITSKGERQFVLKIERIAAPWKESKAENPDAAVGKEAKVVLGPDSRLFGQHVHTLARLKAGDQIVVEAFHFGGEQLTVVELLRKTGVPASEGERREGEVRRPEGGGDRLVPREGEGRPRGEGEPREGEAVVPREGFGGANGLLVGKLLRKGEDGFVLKVEKVTVAPGRTVVENPEGLVGKEVEVTLRREGRLHPQRTRDLAELRPGDRIAVGVRPVEGNALAAVSVLRKADAPAEGGRGEGEGGERKIPRGEGEGREGGERKIQRGEGEGREGGVRRTGEGEGGAPKARTEGGERREGTQASAEVIQGFRGILQGTIQEKVEDGIILRVEKVAKVWQSSQAKNPEGLAGRTVRIVVKREEGEGGLQGALGALKAGDRIVVGAVHNEGDRLVAAETLRKVEGE